MTHGRVLAILIAAALSFGCGSEKPERADPPVAPAAAKTTDGDSKAALTLKSPEIPSEPSATPTDRAGVLQGVVLSKKKKAVANSLVYIAEVEGEFPAPKDPFRMDQAGSQFSQRVVPVLAGTTVEYTNTDAVDHNVYSPDNETFDLGKWKTGAKKKKYDKLGVYTNLCNIHPTMIAYVIVLQNPHFAVTDAGGNFAIKNVPAGTHTVKVWNERLKADDLEVTLDEGKGADLQFPLHR